METHMLNFESLMITANTNTVFRALDYNRT